MSIPQSVKDKRVGLAKQSAYGTPISDGSAFTQLRVDLNEPDWDLDDFQDDQAAGVRFPLAADHVVDSDLAMPSLQMSGLVRQAELPDFFYAYVQSVTEVDVGGPGPFARTYDFPLSSPHQPDFTADEGAFYTLIMRSPGAADSIKIADAIIEQLQLTIEPRGRLSLQATWRGNGIPTLNADPSGTWSLSPAVLYKQSRITTCSYNIEGAGDAAVLLKSASFTLKNTLERAGYDPATGKMIQPLITDRTAEFSLTFERTTTAAQALKAARAAGSNTLFKLGWGGTPPGTASGDALISIYGDILEISDDNENYLGLTVSGEMRAPDTSTSPLTLLEVSAVEKSW